MKNRPRSSPFVISLHYSSLVTVFGAHLQRVDLDTSWSRDAHNPDPVTCMLYHPLFEVHDPVDFRN